MGESHPKLRVRYCSTNGRVPQYSTELASGCDLAADILSPIILASMERRLIPTGIYLEIPPGFEGQVRPRSGISFEKGLGLINSPGTIDADYRGEIIVSCINMDRDVLTIKPGEKIAQIIFTSVVQAQFVSISAPIDLSPSIRAEGRFGSTGSS